MNLWIVIYLFGKVAETIGPLPYGEEICQFRIETEMHNVGAVFKEHGGVIHDPGGGPDVTPEDIRFKCVWSDKRPEISK